MPLTPSEQTILDLRDSGMSVAAIADRLGRSFKAVDRVVTYYTDGIVEDRRIRRAMERGSRELLARLRAELGAGR